MYNHVRGHASRYGLIDVCTDMCMGMCIYMRIDMCMHMRIDMCIDPRIDAFIRHLTQGFAAITI